MKRFLEILKRELKAYFESPVAYVFLVAYLVLMAFFAFFVEKYYEQGQANLDRSFFTWHVWLYLILVPAASMRLWAEERQSGTIELLFTLPIKVTEALLGKFFAAWIFLGIALALTSPIVLTTVLLGGNLDGGAVACGYLGSFLMAGTFLSVGMLTSALTRNQVISFVLSVTIGLVLVLAGFRPITDMFVRWAPGWLVDGVAAFSVTTYFDSMRRGIVDIKDIGYFAGLMILMLTATHVTLQRRRSGKSGGLTGSLAGLLLLACILIAVNIAFHNTRLRADVTDERIFSLSPGTKNVLARLDKPVTLKFFFSSGDPDIPESLPNFPIVKGFARRVDELLNEYRIVSGGKIAVERHDPRYGSSAETWARQYGVAGIPLEELGPSLYMGIVAECGGTFSTLPLLDPKLEDQLEYDITRNIARVIADRRPVIGVVSIMGVLGRPELPFPLPGQTQDAQKPWVAFEGLKQDYDFRRIDMADQINTNDLDALILLNAKYLNPGELYAIDQFALSGKPVAIFVDPICYTEQLLKIAPRQFTMPEEESSIDRLLKAWGVKYNNSMIVGDAIAAWNDNPAVLGLDASHMNTADVLMSRMDMLFMPMAGAFSADGTNDVKITPLISSSEQSSLLPAYLAQIGIKALRDGMNTGEEKTYALAVRVEGKFKTAFPDGRPKTEEAPDGESDRAKPEAEPPQTAGPGLKESAGTCSAVIVGDCDMLYDQFCVEPAFFLGRPSGYQMVNHNIIFFINLVDQIGRGSDLAGIKAKTRMRPFKYVQHLTRNARLELRKKDSELDQKRRETDEKLAELQGKKDPQQRFAWSDEQKATIIALEKDASEIRNQQRQVKSDMRRNVVLLGTGVKAANMLLAPLLVVIGGILFGLRRMTRK